jgi:iron complex transport system ATP-binding protein
MADGRDAIVAELAGVSAGYRSRGTQRTVLDGAELRVAAGEIVAILGANGSGKTTLLRVLAGTLAPSAGAVRLLGRPIADWGRREIARRVAVLPQLVELPSGLTAAEIVALGRIPHATTAFGTTDRDEDAVAEALRDADAEELGHRTVDELSGGERQRVLVALALAQEPRLLLLDEPTLHLDLGHQLALLRMLERLRRSRGLAVVAVLHDLNLAGGWADRSLLLHEGRLVSAAGASGPIDPALARLAFGVAVEEARTEDGRRALVITAALADRDAHAD